MGPVGEIGLSGPGGLKVVGYKLLPLLFTDRKLYKAIQTMLYVLWRLARSMEMIVLVLHE